MVCGYLVHGDALPAAPKIAAADYYGYLYALARKLDELTHHSVHGCGVDAGTRSSRKSFAA